MSLNSKVCLWHLNSIGREILRIIISRQMKLCAHELLPLEIMLFSQSSYFKDEKTRGQKMCVISTHLTSSLRRSHSLLNEN